MNKKKLPERGSFNWYLSYSGSFVTYIAKAIMQADNFNIKRIQRIFPQMIAAYKMNNWNKCPNNFPPEYNAI